MDTDSSVVTAKGEVRSGDICDSVNNESTYIFAHNAPVSLVPPLLLIGELLHYLPDVLFLF